ncbi:MAG: DUF4143 domain-containing protein [Propionibacteriaceae bacterium]|nr:DUF4143 domain-containing protein [Propionibacteriaceae bacterium]
MSDLMSAFPACAIDGPKAVGKTATASRLAAATVRLDRPAEVAAFRQDPDRLSRLTRPLLIDEWQMYPPVWDLVRRSVDDGAGNGSFLLTGSATPRHAPRHSGAGRILHLRMRPFSLSERRIDTPTVSLGELMTGDRPPIHGQSDADIQTYADEITRGGFPRLRTVPTRFRRDAWDGYLSEVFNHDLPELGQSVRRPATLRNWMRSYAAATSTIASYTDILDNACPNDTDKPAKATTLAWREALGRMWLLDPLPAWGDPAHHLGRLASGQKHHLADPALAAHLLGVTAKTLLTSTNPTSFAIPVAGTLFGALFESLVTQSILVYASIIGIAVSHLRTRNGDHEIDLIASRDDGRIVAIEVKSSADIDRRDTRHLVWLRERMGEDVLDTVIVNTGPAAYRRDDGVAVVPASLLGI